MIKHLPKLPALILILGAILRIAGTGASAIWFDEANMIYRSTVPFLELFSNNTEMSGDILSELIQRPLLALSHSLWVLRLPSILAGLLSLWLVWILMQRLNFNLRQQIFTTAIAAVLPGLLWIAQDARAYGLLACLFLAAIWFALESRLLGLLAACGLMIYTHSTGPVYAVAALLIAVYVHPWKIRRLSLVAFLVLVFWIPAVVRIFTHWVVNQPWQPVITFPWILYSTVTAIWPLNFREWFFVLAILVLLRTLFYFFHKGRALGRIVPLLAWMVPVLALIVYSLIFHHNAFLYRVVMPALPPFALWLGWELGRKPIRALNYPYLWTAMLLLGLALWHPTDRGGGLDRVASQIRSQWRTGDALVYTTVTVGLPLDYYLGDLPHLWDYTVTDGFLQVPDTRRADVPPPTGEPLRTWYVIPDDGLVTPEEESFLMDMVRHQEPVYSVRYMQAATINIYLVEGKI